MITQDTNAIFHTSIGDVVRAWREEQDLTVTELAQLSGQPISKGYISQLEHNKVRQPSDDHLVRIAAALHIPVLYLVTRRLPDELSPDEQAELAAMRNTTEVKKGAMSGFASPIQASLGGRNGKRKREEASATTAPQQSSLNEEAQLRLISEKLKELQALVDEFMANKSGV